MLNISFRSPLVCFRWLFRDDLHRSLIAIANGRGIDVSGVFAGAGVRRLCCAPSPASCISRFSSGGSAAGGLADSSLPRARVRFPSPGAFTLAIPPMKSLLERYAKTPAVIGLPVEGAVLDGAQEYAEHPAEVLVLKTDTAVQDAAGGVRMRRHILVSPGCGAAPAAGGYVAVEGRRYDIAEVKPYRTLEGVPWGWLVGVAL